MMPRPRISGVIVNGTVGRDGEYATGELVRAISLAVALRARPIDRFNREGALFARRFG